MGSQPLATDRPAASLARPVGAGVDVVQGGIEGGDVGLGLSEKVDDQRPLEADGRSFGVVLVVGRRQGGRLDDGLPVPPEAGGAGQGPLPLGF